MLLKSILRLIQNHTRELKNYDTNMSMGTSSINKETKLVNVEIQTEEVQILFKNEESKAHYNAPKQSKESQTELITAVQQQEIENL